MSNNPIEGQEVKLPGAVFGKVETVEGYPQYAVAPILLRAGSSKYPTGRAMIFRDGLYKADVSERYKLLPNERALSIADQVADELGFKQFKYIESKGGNVMHSTYLAKDLKLSDIPHTFVEPELGDGVNLGFSIHNSIDGSTSFGSMLFSYRGVCKNGAILGVKKLNSAPAKRHTKKMEEFTKEFKVKLKVFLLENLEPLAQFYKSLPVIQVNLEVAKAFADSLPVRYLPSAIVVERRTHEIKVVENINAWTAYNFVTDALWHNPGKVEASSASVYMTNLHKNLQPLVMAQVVA